MDSYCVYRHVAPNGKMYVGITGRDPKKRWKNGHGYRHNDYLFRAIQKYGWNNFQHDILLTGLTAEQAGLAERLFIGYWQTNDIDHGYNFASGGLTLCEHSDVSKQKMSKSRKGVKFSEEHKRKLSKAQSGCLNHNYGKTISADVRKKISESTKGEKNHFYGKHHTEETKRKISEAKQNISDETRRKMSERRPKKRVVQMDRESDMVLNIFESMHEAERVTGVRNDHICGCCRNKAKTAGGYKWKYYDEYIKVT